MIIEVKIQDSAGPMIKSLQKGLADTTDLTQKVGFILQAQIQDNAMSGHGHHDGGYPNAPTGRMAGSVTTRLISPARAIVGTNVFYAPFVEFGHSQHIGQFVPPLKKRLVNARAPAYPFFFKAIAQTADKVQKLIVDYINKLVGK